MRPKLAMIRPLDNKFRIVCFDLAMNRYFELFILLCILLNTLILTLKWTYMSKGAIFATEVINYVFTIIFVIECIIKLIAFGCRYFKDPWNVFDFTIVAGSIVFVLIQHFFGIGFSTTT